tara:strand:+ start:517 stop:1221 length:705 start_codon:yes stop_codon:yes gene_type:complete
MSKLISPTFIKNVKKSAKSLKKELNIDHTKALELASKEAGFSSYHALQTTFENQKKPEIDFIQEVRQILISYMESDSGGTAIKANEYSLSQYHDTSDIVTIKSKVLTKLLDAFDNGIEHNGKNISADYSLLTSGPYNESIKEAGYSLMKEDDIKQKVMGNILVSLGHYYRSVHDCFKSKRLIHPNFEVYLSDWIRSVRADGQHASEIMHKLYSSNKYNGLRSGTTYWKPFNKET